MDIELFEQYIAEALAMIPPHIRRKIENVAWLVEPGTPRGRLLGLYHGIPMTQRHLESYTGVLPDTITIFMKPIEQEAGSDPTATRRLVHEVVHHEVGHYFGFSEAKVRKWEGQRAKKRPLSHAQRNLNGSSILAILNGLLARHELSPTNPAARANPAAMITASGGSATRRNQPQVRATKLNNIPKTARPTIIAKPRARTIRPSQPNTGASLGQKGRKS